VILTKGGDWFASVGTEKSKGSKVFALAGKITNSGLVEIPMGTPLRQIVEDIGGGIPNKRKFKAAQTGGPSGGCIPAEHFDVPMDYENLTQLGAIMGSGGLIITDETTCMVDMARFFLSFTQKESCGKCVPCRLGTKKMLEILTAVTEGTACIEDIDQLTELAENVKIGSLCGLGQTAPNPALSTVRYFRDEYEAHILKKECPARVCIPLIKFEVNEENCTKCGSCLKACPSDAVTWKKKEFASIDKDKCIKCRACILACRFHAID
jgi:NADH:ubiquinone oxidoreductase subunit F (NADH-binding)